MSTDAATAAFFAKKKGKKKTFKAFNANKVNASSLATSIYIDPADVDVEPYSAREQVENGGSMNKSAGELLDMKALEQQRRVEDDVASRIALEETRAQLAAAKLNMEKEAQRLDQQKVEKEKAVKKEEEKLKEKSGDQAGSKWIAPHLRGSSKTNFSSSTKKAVLDGEAFPDLVDAVSANDTQKIKMPKAPRVKKLPVALSADNKCERSFAESEADSNDKYDEEALTHKKTALPNGASTNQMQISAPTLVKKKKKKDLSTFKSI